MTIQEEKGFTLVEVIVAISILTFGMLAVATMQATALRGDRFAYNRTEGATLGQDKLEEFMRLPYDDARLSNNNHEEEEDGLYDVFIDVVDGTVSNTKRITVTIYFNERQINQMIAVRSSLME